MISLQIPYVKDEFHKERMSSYIDDIIIRAEEFSDYTAKLKYIQSALSLKKLFSIIVSVMNAIKLILFKRERIRERMRAR